MTYRHIDRHIDRGDIILVNLSGTTATELVVITNHDGWLHACEPQHAGLVHAIRNQRVVLIEKQANYAIAPSRIERRAAHTKHTRKKATPEQPPAARPNGRVFGTSFIIYCMPNPDRSATAVPIGAGINAGSTGQRIARVLRDVSAAIPFAGQAEDAVLWREQAVQMAKDFVAGKLPAHELEAPNIRSSVPVLAEGESVSTMLETVMATAMPWAAIADADQFETIEPPAPKPIYQWRDPAWRKPGQRVLVARTGHPPIAGTLIAVNKAWLNVKADAPEAGRIIRCRVSAVSPIIEYATPIATVEPKKP